MDRLHSFLIAFVAKNVDSEAPGWVQPSVTISGWDMCGEGEHKIMAEIRRLRQLEELAASRADCSETSFSEFFLTMRATASVAWMQILCSWG